MKTLKSIGLWILGVMVYLVFFVMGLTGFKLAWQDGAPLLSCTLLFMCGGLAAVIIYKLLEPKSN